MDPPINNFKGVMLCNRPNENLMVTKEKPFCSRVQPQEQWGLLAQKQDEGINPVMAPTPNPVLERHKKWLEEFKLQNIIKKQAKQEAQVRDEDKFNRVRELAKKDREVTKKMKEEYRTMNEMISKEMSEKQQPPTTVKLTEQNLKKLEEKDNVPKDKSKKRYKTKPVWAMTKEEEEQHIKNEEDELLAFVENLDYDQYIDDLEFNVMLKAMQQRVGELKQDDKWKEKAEQHYENRKNEQQQPMEEDIYDKISHSLSKNSEARSVHSEKTQNSINSLKKKKEEQLQGKAEWDKATTANNDKKVSIEDRIAKHVADEILRNYKNLSNVHSNGSIRKILEREAKKTLQEGGLAGPVIQIIKNEKGSKVDPNTLPYLHRNPAI